MPQLQLVYLRSSPQPVGSEIIYYERIKALLDIGNAGNVRHDCLVDTGAVLSMFPEKRWKLFEKEVDWLYVPGSGTNLPDWLCKVTGLGAQSIDCRIGKIALRIVELPLTSPIAQLSPAIEIIAKFPYDAGAYTQILLGLGGRAFSGWKLVVDGTNHRSWLEY